jgi:hypothetical protein
LILFVAKGSSCGVEPIHVHYREDSTVIGAFLTAYEIRWLVSIRMPNLPGASDRGRSSGRRCGVIRRPIAQRSYEGAEAHENAG